MEVKASPPPRPVPPSVYDITGLSEEEALFLRSLLGRFTCNPGRTEGSHCHSQLFVKLNALTRGMESPFTIVNSDNGAEAMLRCERKK